MVREFINKEMKVDMPAAPAAYAGRQDMLHALNPEFAKRLDALLAIYQAHGGTSATGIAPPTGGNRTAAQQYEIFKKCRRIRRPPDGGASGDGSRKEHWELIPILDRCCSSEEVAFRFREEDGTLESYYTTTPRAEVNCPVLYYQKFPGNLVYPVLGPATMAWVSWHNLGLAVDLREVRRDKRGNPQLILPSHDEAWRKMEEEAVGFLGMTWGGWWKSFPDPGHVEWHPRLRNAEQFGDQSGTALSLTDEQIGYKYRMPASVFTWDETPGQLTVHELVAEGQWISLKSYRSVRRKSPEWEGHWFSFDPPIRLFPAYIPTIRFARDESEWPHDKKWRAQTRVVARSYYHRPRDRQSFERTGTAIYRTVVTMEDWQKRANIATQRGDPDKPQYIRMRDSSVYEVRLAVGLGDEATEWSYKSQEIDENGYTKEGNYQRRGSIDYFGLSFAWHRDTGALGEEVKLVPAEKQQVYDIAPSTRLSSSLPEGAWDRPTHPDWVPPNPRPKPTNGGSCPGCALTR